MGYEVEISIDLKKNKNGLKTVDSLIEIADNNNCKTLSDSFIVT